MKCKHRFRVDGRVRPDRVFPVRSRFYTWHFELSDGFITHVTAIADLPDPGDWPAVRQDAAPGAVPRFDPKAPHLVFIMAELRTIQGFLSLFGVRSIDLLSPELEWLPENEQERSALKIKSFKIQATDPDPGPVAFDLIARSILAADKGYRLETPLSFFRRSLLDLREHQFIEAFYDLYFVLETLFGNGKTRKRDVLAEFKASQELNAAVVKALQDPGPMRSHVRGEYERKFRSFSAHQYLAHVVEIRGFLHHHSQRRAGIWHPERQERYEADAFVLHEVASHVVYDLALAYFDEPEVIAAFRESERVFLAQSGPHGA